MWEKEAKIGTQRSWKKIHGLLGINYDEINMLGDTIRIKKGMYDTANCMVKTKPKQHR